ncbi:hypothetical protein CW304_00480 [Bacillus sp. UFRGS-B20]|nr:hypothetical protein CW304_00480 [Bacillus sp. UFRGS-B20]
MHTFSILHRSPVSASSLDQITKLHHSNNLSGIFTPFPIVHRSDKIDLWRYSTRSLISVV